MFIKKTLLNYCLRRVVRRPVSLSVCVLLTAFCIYCFLAVFNFYSSAVEASADKQNLLLIKARDSSYQLATLQPLLDRISKFASIDYSDSLYIKIKANNNSQLLSVAQSIKSALAEKDFKIALQSEFNQQTNEIVQSLLTNILVVVLLLGLVSSLIIAGNAELSLIEGRKDLKRMQFLCCSKKQILFVVGVQFLLQAICGSLLGLIAYQFLGDFVNKYLLQTLSAIPDVSQNIEVSANPYMAIIAIIYGIAISTFAALWAYYRQLIKPSKKMYSLSSRYFFYLSVFLVFITLLLSFRSKILIALLIVNTLVFASICTYKLYNLSFKHFSHSNFLQIRLSASYLRANKNWIYLPCISIALSFTVLVSLITMLNSFDKTFNGWLLNTLSKDVFITVGQFNAVAIDKYIDSEKIAELCADSRLHSFSYLSSSLERFNSSSILLHGSSDSLEKLAKIYNFKEQNSDSYANGSAILVNEIFASRFGNNNFTLFGKSWKVAGIYRDFGSQLPTLMMPFGIFSSLTGVKNISSISFKINQEQNQPLVFNQIQKKFSDRYSVYSRSELTDQALNIFYKTFNFTKAMNFALIVLIISTSFLLIMLCLLQHLKALKLLQILGLSTASFCGYMISFSLLIVVPALVTGTIAGLLLADILVNSMNPALFGWSLDYHLPYSEYLYQTIFIILSVIVSSLISYKSQINNLDSIEFSSE